MINENLKHVHKVMEEAAKKAARKVDEVTLVAVSKTKPLEAMLECLSLGETVFGENYVQEIVQKYETLQEENAQALAHMQFHMIGHLQRNKVKYIIDKVQMIHSVDSMRLAEAIEKEAAKKEIVMPVLLEVNVAQEETKWGFSMEEIEAAIREIQEACPHVLVKGLMTSAPYTEDPESNRPYFQQLKQKLDELKKEFEQLDTLSMGMTGDYAVAIEEGATLIRVGTGIFGARDYANPPQ